MAVVKANYVQVGSQAWASRISAAMTYYSRRPGDDLDHEEETPAAERRFQRTHQRDEPHVEGRFFHTSDGEQIPLAEAEDRFFAQVEARKAAWREQQEALRAERKTARDAAFEDKCRRFVAGEDARPGRPLTSERREQLVERWRQTREARERLPDPVFRIYRVVLSTERAWVDGRDVRLVLEQAVVGMAGAVAGSVGHAAKTVYRSARREHERLARERAREEARAARAEWHRDSPWMFVRHDTGSHPHVHALFLTDGHGLKTPDLDRMREILAERELVREREQDAAKQRASGGRER